MNRDKGQKLGMQMSDMEERWGKVWRGLEMEMTEGDGIKKERSKGDVGWCGCSGWDATHVILEANNGISLSKSPFKYPKIEP